MNVHSWMFALTLVGVIAAMWPFIEGSQWRVIVVLVLVGVANVCGCIRGESR